MLTDEIIYTMKKPVTLNSKVYKNIKDNILNGILQPRKRLYESELAKEYGTSRGPIRETLARLSEEKLVYAIPRKGVFVVPISKKEIEGIFEIRENLELLAVKKSIGKFPLIEFKKIENELIAFENLEMNHENKLEYLSVDRKFHYLLFKNCDNDRLIDLLIHLQEQMKRFQKYTLSLDSFRLTINEHLDIIESVKKNDFTLIKSSLLKHFKRVEESYFYQFME